MVVQCCVCLKVRDGKRWTKVTNPQEVMRHASHTYCPRCMKRSLESLKKCRT